MRTIPVTDTKYTAAFKNFTAAYPTFTVQSYKRVLDQFVIGARVSATKNCLGASFNYEGNFGSGTSLDEFDLTLFYQF